MGKRRSLKPLNPDDRFKNDDDDDEDENEVENQTEEPLRPEEMDKIQSRKKLVAKRRVADAAPGGFSFGGFGSAAAKPALGSTSTTAAASSSMFGGNSNHSSSNGGNSGNESDKPAFTFSGFKGFSAMPPAMPTATTAPTSSNGAASTNFLFKPTADSSSSSSLLSAKPAPAPSISTTFATSSSSTFGGAPSSSVVNSESITLKEKTNGNTNTATTNSSSELMSAKNITETELSFINGLEELYKRCYSSNVKSRHYKLPIEVLNNSNIDSLGSEDDLKAKYAYLLAELNRNTSKWISKHVEESPLVILTPIFVDYFNYLILLEKQFFPEIFPKSLAAAGKTQSMDAQSSSLTSVSAAISSGGSSLPVPFGDSSRRGGFEEKENNHGKPQQQPPSFKLNGSEHTFNLGANTQQQQQQQQQSSSSLSSSTSLFGKSNLTNTTAASADKPSAVQQHTHLNGHNKSVSVSSTSSSLTSSGATMKIGDDGDDDEEEDDDDDEEEDEDDDVQEIPSDDAKLAESSKTFAALIKSSSSSSDAGASNSKPLFGGSDSTFAFKPQQTSATETSKEAPATAPFKFGTSASTASTTSTVSLTSTASSTAAVAVAETSFSLAQSTKLSFLTKPMSSEGQALFTFGAKKEEKAEETSSSKPTAAAFFGTLGGGSSSTASNKEDEPASGSNAFKSFSTFGAGNAATFGASSGASSLFGSLSKPTSSDSSSATPAAATTANKPFFSFQSVATEKVDLAKPTGGIFGNLPPPGSGGLFGSLGSSGSSIFAAASANPIGEGGDAEDEPYEPPKPESSDVHEEGAVFTKRVKMYYFNGEKFCERGISNLYLKPSSNGEKTQLIVRTDTKLAAILLNIILTKSLPTSKIGAKDVSLFCVPNPPISDPKLEAGKPCKFLFKVKTESDADELLEKLSEYKR